MGELDLEAIAADTTMQNTIEESFEFVKDFPFKNAQVFSIVNGGYTGFKDVLIAEKKSIREYDTLYVLRLDDEQIQEAFLSDLDGNNSPEIHLIVLSKKTQQTKDRVVLQKQGKWQEVLLPAIPNNFQPMGSWQWGIENDLLRYSFAITERDSTQPSGSAKVYFKLKNNIFTVEKAEAIL